MNYLKIERGIKVIIVSSLFPLKFTFFYLSDRNKFLDVFENIEYHFFSLRRIFDEWYTCSDDISIISS